MSRTNVVNLTPTNLPTIESIENEILHSNYALASTNCDTLLEATTEDKLLIAKLYFTKSKAELGQRKFSEAEDAINLAIENTPDNEENNAIKAEYYTYKSQILMYLGSHKASLDIANKAIEFDSSSISAYVFKGIAFKHLLKEKEAATAFIHNKHLIPKEIKSDGIKHDLEMSWLARNCEKFDIAIQYSQFVIDAAPDYSAGYIHKGINLLQKYIGGKKDASVSPTSAAIAAYQLITSANEAFDKAISLTLKDGVITDCVSLYYKGIIADVQEDAPLALSLYKQSADLNPAYLNAIIAIINLHMARGEDSLALGLIDELLAKNPNNEEALLAKVKALISTDDFESAMINVEMLIKIDPENYYYLYKKSLVQSALHDFKGAMESCQAALELKENDLDVLYHQALTFAALDQYKEALGLIKNIIKLNPQFAPAYQAQGFILSEIVKAGDDFNYYYSYSSKLSAEKHSPGIDKLIGLKYYQQAEMWYYNYITEANKHCFESFGVGLEQFESGSYQFAKASFQEAVALNPKFVLAIIKLSEVQTKLGNLAEAAELINLSKEISIEYTESLLTEEKKAPHLLAIEKEALDAHDMSIKLDSSNPIFYSSKASSLGKFHIVVGMLECTEKAEELLKAEQEKSHGSDQKEYLKHQIDMRLELLEEVKKLIESAQSIHSSLDVISQSTSTVGEVISDKMEKFVELSPALSRAYISRFPSFNHTSGVNTPGLDNSGSLSAIAVAGNSNESTASSVFTHTPSSIDAIHSTISPRGGMNLSIIAPYRSTSISLTTSRDSTSPEGVSPIIDATPGLTPSPSITSSIGSKNFMTIGSTPKIRDIFPPTKLTTSTSHGGAGRSEHSEEASHDRTRSESAPLRLTHACNESNLHPEAVQSMNKTSEVVQGVFQAVAKSTATMSELQNLLNLTKEMQRANIELQEKMAKENAELKAEIAAIKHNYVKSGDIPFTIEHDSELYTFDQQLKLINNNTLLKEYYTAFVKTFQKYIIGFLARNSGEVAESSIKPHLTEFIPFPAVIDNVINILEEVIDTGVQIVKNNQIIRTLNSIPDASIFINKTIQKAACEIALRWKNNEIINLEPAIHTGIFKIRDYYKQAKKFIFEEVNVTPQMELGASDALKLLAAFKSGKVVIEEISLTTDQPMVNVMVNILLDQRLDNTFFSRLKKGFFHTIKEDEDEADTEAGSEAVILSPAASPVGDYRHSPSPSSNISYTEGRKPMSINVYSGDGIAPPSFTGKSTTTAFFASIAGLTPAGTGINLPLQHGVFVSPAASKSTPFQASILTTVKNMSESESTPISRSSTPVSDLPVSFVPMKAPAIQPNPTWYDLLMKYLCCCLDKENDDETMPQGLRGAYSAVESAPNSPASTRAAGTNDIIPTSINNASCLGELNDIIYMVGSP